MQKEITEKGPLLDEKGHLTTSGYARKLLLDYDRSRIKANKLRIKEWDYYFIYDDEYGLALTIDDNSYMGLGGVSVIDFKTPKETTVNLMSVMPLGKSKMPSSSQSGSCFFKQKDAYLAFYNNGAKRDLQVNFPNFNKETLTASVTLTDAPEESMVIVTPYKEDKKTFYYTPRVLHLII